MRRPEWDDYLMGLALAASQRSPDEQTKHGAVIVDGRRRILATGYNGWPHSLLGDHTLPTVRPAKYPWMIHAEANAFLSADRSLEGGVCYVTGRSCVACLMGLWQRGVTTVVEMDRPGWSKDDDESHVREDFLRRSCMDVATYRPNLSWLEGLARFAEELGFA